MAKLTRPVSSGLDALRRTFLGRSATLQIIKHKKGGSGYEKVVEVKRGWHFQPGKVGEPSTLQICESKDVTEEQLKGVHFAVSGRVFKINNNEFSSPAGTELRLWVFKLVPTGEPFP